MPTERQIDRLDTNFSQMLDIRGRPKVPDAISSVAVATIPVFGTSPWGNVLFDSKVGAAGVLSVELTKTPEGKIRVPVAIELSHNDTSAHQLRIFLKWDRAGVTTSVALPTPQPSANQNIPVFVTNLQRVYLGPTARLLGDLLTLGASKVLTLKMAYFELTLGETAPP